MSNPQVSIDAVLQKLSAQSAAKDLRIATLEAMLDQMKAEEEAREAQLAPQSEASRIIVPDGVSQ